jgi:hypothetical protein
LKNPFYEEELEMSIKQKLSEMLDHTFEYNSKIEIKGENEIPIEFWYVGDKTNDEWWIVSEWVEN